MINNNNNVYLVRFSFVYLVHLSFLFLYFTHIVFCFGFVYCFCLNAHLCGRFELKPKIRILCIYTIRARVCHIFSLSLVVCESMPFSLNLTLVLGLIRTLVFAWALDGAPLKRYFSLTLSFSSYRVSVPL